MAILKFATEKENCKTTSSPKFILCRLEEKMKEHFTRLPLLRGRRFGDIKSHRKDQKALVHSCEILTILHFIFNCHSNFERLLNPPL